MSLGYVKGKYWVADERFAAYAKQDDYKDFLRAVRDAGITFNCTYSYVSRSYFCEVITYERFKGSAQIYEIKHNSASDPHPLLACAAAVAESHLTTPLLKAFYLEFQCKVMAEQLRARSALETRLTTLLDNLADVIGEIPISFTHHDKVVAVVHLDEDDDL